MDVKTGFDPDSNKMHVFVSTNLLKKYHVNFRGLLLGKISVKGLEVNVKGENEAVVSFPVGKDKVKVVGDKAMVGIEKDTMENIMGVIYNFADSALRKELSTTEFIPLQGYAEDLLIEDAKNAASNKRNLCIIDTYDSYLKNDKERNYEFNQYFIDYGTDEYYDAIITITSGNIDVLRKTYKKKLKRVNWL